jgi:hypothetical protein
LRAAAAAAAVPRRWATAGGTAALVVGLRSSWVSRRECEHNKPTKAGAMVPATEKCVIRAPPHACALASSIADGGPTRHLHASQLHTHPHTTPLHSTSTAKVRCAPRPIALAADSQPPRCSPVLPSAPPRPQPSSLAAASSRRARKCPAHTTTPRVRAATCHSTR